MLIGVALEVRGEPIMSQGELNTLVRSLDRRGRGSGTLQAFFAGEQIPPDQLAACLDVEARIAARDPATADPIINTVLDRLARAFPDEVPA